MLDNTKTLAAQLEKLKTDFISQLTPEVQQDVGGAFQRLMDSDTGASAVAVGEQVPDFILATPAGEQRRLSDYLAQGPVVLDFYRGGWCPFCNLEFRALLERLPEIESLGASLVGISPEIAEVSTRTIEENGIGFDVLCDPGNVLSRQWGLVMSVDETVRPHYLNWGIDIPAANGDDSYELPLPATYVIDTNAVVRAAFIDKDYTRRMEPQAIIDALKAL